MKFFRISICVAILTVVLSACGTGQSIPPQIGLELLAGGFTSPVALIDPDDGTHRLFVVDQTGLIRILAEGRQIQKPFLDIRERIVELNAFYEERGLLGLAFHPDFANNGRFYVSYSGHLQSNVSPGEWDHTTYISEFTVSTEDPNQADPNSERILLAIDKPGYNYEAGHIAFGPDGFLYIATGDSVRDPATEAGKYAQDVNSLLGKILRIDVDGTSDVGQNYRIPSDNPFITGEGRPEIFAYGFRNPYRFSFDAAQDKSFDVLESSETRLFAADVGQAMMEEVDLVESGGNYGWPVREGTSCFNSQRWDQPLERCASGGVIEPVIVYTHKDDLSAVIGGFVYRGNAIPELKGGYIFGDWGRGRGHLFVARPRSFGWGRWSITEIQIEFPADQSQLGQLLGIGQDTSGELYLLTKSPGIGVTGNSGAIYKIVPAK